VSDKTKIAIVIPLYRAEKHIGAVLRGIPAFISHIIIINDCSPDQSAKIVQNISDARICLISHQTNQGVGGAVRTGYQKALELGAEIVVKMDSDDQMDPAYLLPLLTPILTGQADYTKGNRFLHINELQKMPFIRRIGNAGLSFMTKIASGYWNIFDPTNGYTAIHSSIIPLLETKKIHKRYFFESNMLIELGIIRAVIQDVHIPARYQDETSSLSEWKVLFEFPPLLLAGFLRRFVILYFLRDFGIVSMLSLLGISFSIFGTIFGAYHWQLSSQLNVPASTGTVMIAVLPLIMGFQLLIQALNADIQNIPTEPLQKKIADIKRLIGNLNL
jgi:dolichol-phosphate mannosyltransferase